MFICSLSPNKKKITQYSSFQTRVLCKFFFLHFIYKTYPSLVYSSTVLHGTRVSQARVPHNFFYSQKFHVSNATVAELRGTRVSETRFSEKVVLCYLFPKQWFFAKNFKKKWYWAILANFAAYLAEPNQAWRICLVHNDSNMGLSVCSFVHTTKQQIIYF